MIKREARMINQESQITDKIEEKTKKAEKEPRQFKFIFTSIIQLKCNNPTTLS
jgi:hypothetical protein